MTTDTTTANVDAELSQYIETALWSTSIEETFAAEHNARTGEDWAPDTGMLDFGFTVDDLAPTTVDVMRADVVAFLADQDHADALTFWAEELGDGQIGHDLWLTRNGHGAGFWDRFHRSEPGESFGRALTDACKPFGESYLYVGDDGRIYVS